MQSPTVNERAAAWAPSPRAAPESNRTGSGRDDATAQRPHSRVVTYRRSRGAPGRQEESSDALLLGTRHPHQRGVVLERTGDGRKSYGDDLSCASVGQPEDVGASPEGLSQLGLNEILPTAWGFDDSKCAVWVPGFRVFLAPSANFAPNPAFVDFDGIRVVRILGTWPFQTGGELRIGNWRGAGPVEFLVSASQPGSFVGALFVVLVRAEVEWGPEEPTNRQVVETLEGAARAALGHNIAYDRAFDYVLAPGNPIQFSAVSDSVVNPASFPEPGVGEGDLNGLSAFIDALSTLPEPTERRRIELGIRWFNEASDRSGIDAFLRFWIAIEVFKMPDSSNISPVHSALAEIYDVDLQQAQEEFAVGRVFRLRGAILHDGYRPALPADVESYVRALAVDMVHHSLGLPVPRAARDAMTAEVRTAILNLTAELLSDHEGTFVSAVDWSERSPLSPANTAAAPNLPAPALSTAITSGQDFA